MSIDIKLIAAELQRHVVQDKKVIKSDFARATATTVDQYCRKVTKIKGTYQVLDSIMSHIVQGFKPEWKELGVFSVGDKELKNYHQKVNFGFIPADILSSALADWYEQDKTPTNKEICKRIVEWIFIQVKDDVELLSQIGVYDQAQAHGGFGYSMNGWNQIIKSSLANTARPVFKIPVDAITDLNILDVVQDYERKLPKILKTKIKSVFMSENNVERYGIAYKEKYNLSPSYDERNQMKSPLGRRSLVGLPNLNDDIIFGTVDGNMLNLIDVIDNPSQFTDVQVQDYMVKLFLEFWKGYDFLINEAVCIADFEGTVRGLGNDERMKLYFPHERV